MLKSVKKDTHPSPKALVIWMHGLGADGHDFADIIPELGLPKDLAVQFIFPHAPIRPVTLNGGMPMRAWYDITALTAEGRDDRVGLAQSTKAVHELIEGAIKNGIPSEKIALVGFSQGGAMALHAGLRHPGALAGLVALSGYLPLAADYPDVIETANQSVPVWMGHGQDDEVVRHEWGAKTAEHLKAWGLPVSWNDYPHLEHSVHAEELQTLGRFLATVLG